MKDWYATWLPIAGAAAIVAWGVVCAIGDVRGLRNPLVKRPLLAAIPAAVLALIGISTTVTLVAACATMVLVGIATLEATSRKDRIEQLLHLPEELRIGKATGGKAHMFARDIAESSVTQRDLEQLLRFVDQTDGAPHYRWLTPEWVRARLNEQRNGASLIRGSASQSGDRDGLNR